ncbi:hypothetical protein [Hydrogenobacter thermophilus]|uniref:hypothetical protein n=1 Tax=Hydrogenobacter thermophilus TaxID=940 RepID=UPI0030F528E4
MVIKFNKESLLWYVDYNLNKKQKKAQDIFKQEIEKLTPIVEASDSGFMNISKDNANARR